MNSEPREDERESGSSVLTIRVRPAHLIAIGALVIGIAGFALGRVTADDEQPVLYGLPADAAAVSPATGSPSPVPGAEQAPSEPVDVEIEGSPARGPEDAEVTVVEFIDFECPFCGAYARETLPRLERAYGEEILYVSRAFPLDIHANADIAARAGYCADQQDSYWELHELLFANQEALARKDMTGHARHLGLDLDAFEECLDSQEAEESVSKDLEDGRSYGVTGTPTFFVDGVPYRGNLPFEELSSAIDEALAEG